MFGTHGSDDAAVNRGFEDSHDAELDFDVLQGLDQRLHAEIAVPLGFPEESEFLQREDIRKIGERGRFYDRIVHMIVYI